MSKYLVAIQKWFGHDPEKWAELRKKYRQELRENKQAIKTKFSEFHLRKPIILLYAAKDEKHNNAIVFKEFLEDILSTR